MTTDTMILASERNAAASGSLADPEKPVSEEKKPLENGEIPAPEGEEPEAEETETEDPEGEEVEETEEELKAKAEAAKPKKKGGFQKRIDKLNGRLSAVEQEREYWRSEALRTKQTERPPEVIAKPDLSKRPKADDFKTVEEYQEALTDWKVDQKLAAREQKQREDSVRTEFQTKAYAHAERVRTLSADKEDWDEVQDTFKRIQLSAAVEQLILDAGEDSAKLVYELGKDPAELEKICKLPVLQAAKAIGRIEAKLSIADPKTPPPKDKKTAVAPKPPTPVRTKGASAPKGYRDNMSLKEYEAWRAEAAAKR